MALTTNTAVETTNLPSSSELSKDDIVDLLMDDEQVPPAEPEKKETPKKEEVTEEDDEEKLETKEDEETEPEIEDFHAPVSRKEILKKYPTLFKDFPYLQTAYYRDQQFTEKFATPAEADEIIKKAETYDKFEQVLSEGNLSQVLKAIKAKDENNFGKVVDEYLGTLYEVDLNAYNAVLGNIITTTVQEMLKEAKNIENEDLKSAAILLNQFVFGNSQLRQPTKFSKETDPKLSEKERQLQEREQKLAKEKFDSAYTELDSKVQNLLKSTVDRYIDPKESMSGYVRKNAVNDVLNEAREVIDKDTAFRRTIDNLWKRSFEEDFSRRSLDTIRSAYLSKAKTVLPNIIKKVRAEILKDTKTAKKEENKEEKRGPLPPGRTAASSTPKSSETKERNDNPSRGKSTLDYLMED